jgi:hypothetical protein
LECFLHFFALLRLTLGLAAGSAKAIELNNTKLVASEIWFNRMITPWEVSYC